MTTTKEYRPLDTSELETLAILVQEKFTDEWRPVGLNILRQCKLANTLAGVLEHAIELGYFGEGGSTENWAKEALKAYLGEK